MNQGEATEAIVGLDDVTQYFTRLAELLWDPTANLSAALLLYGIIALTLLVFVVLILMFAFGTSEEDEETDAPPASAAVASPEVPSSPVDPHDRLRRRVAAWGVGAGVLLVVWLATGFSTAQPAACGGCHTVTAHNQTTALADPHKSTGCVNCHEAGGPVGRYAVNVPFRLSHFTDGLLALSLHPDYGAVSQSACEACHRSSLRGVVSDKERGLRMSHAEPLDAAASCLDCHLVKDGVVAGHNAGMNPCLRCHDSRIASSECSTCHDKQAAAAARASSTDFARAQVDEVRCGGCHNERRQCDPCHGTRMPHDETFMLYAHARAATVEFWYGDGTGCTRSSCHTATRRPCSRCHGALLGKGHGVELARWHKKAGAESCDNCHQTWAAWPQRDFCKDPCHSEAALRYSPR